MDTECQGYEIPLEDPLEVQDVLTSVAGMNLGKMSEAGVASAEIAKHIRVTNAIARTLLSL